MAEYVLPKKILENIQRSPEEFAAKRSDKTLVKILRILDERYYLSPDGPLVDDDVYDRLRTVLEERSPENEYLSQIGVTAKPSTKKRSRVDVELSASTSTNIIEDVKLPFPMASLNKIKLTEPEKLNKFLKLYPHISSYTVSDKLDGVSVLVYRKSSTVKMYTRGDSEYGSDISYLAKVILDENSIPKNVAIRGELIISKNNFKKISGDYKNSRNALAMLRSKNYDPKLVKLVDFVAYNTLNVDINHSTQLSNLENIGIKTVHYSKTKDISIEKLREILSERKLISDYEIDGIVICANDTPKVFTSKNPDWAFAFKMTDSANVADTTVEKVTWTCSKHLYLKPVLQITPVELSGVTISNTTGFNAEYIQSNKIGVGSVITITRSGDVIPHILAVKSAGKKLSKTPGREYLPIDVEWEFSKSGKDIIQSSSDDVHSVKVLASFFSVLEIKHISEGILSKLVDEGYDDIFKILNAETFEDIPGIKKSTSDKIKDGLVNKLKECEIIDILVASGYFPRGIGRRKLKLVVDEYPNILVENFTVDILTSIKGYDDVTAGYVIDGLKLFKKKFYNRIVKLHPELNFERFVDISNVEVPLASSENSPVYKKTVVFTGIRDKSLEKYITDNSGKVTTSVSKNTDILVTAENDKSSLKYLKAKELISSKVKLVNIYTLSEFREIVGI